MLTDVSGAKTLSDASDAARTEVDRRDQID